MTAGRTSLLPVLLALLSLQVSAQKSKTQLQKEKQQQLQRIKEVEKILSETSGEKTVTLGKLNALNQRIRDQENLIRSVKAEIAFLDKDLSEDQQVILALEEDVSELKAEYSRILFSMQKSANELDRLTYLFSASSFNQLLMRFKYLEQYDQTRRNQTESIRRIQGTLETQVKATEEKKKEKNRLLSEEVRENLQLSDLRKQQTTTVRSLEKQEKQLKTDLEETRKAVAKLDKLISDIIREEMERERLARLKAARSNEEIALSSSFEGNRKKLPWPVDGFVSQGFGRQPHPVLKHVELRNDGINIQTKQNEMVRSVFDGEVRRVAFIPTLGSTVIINHGEYYSVYSGMKDVLVKAGQKVKINEEIGTMLSNPEGVSELRFQIRKNTEPLDPQSWLRE
jgi:septal ring factor EnvC (AmiA/AmiB activator)